MFVVNGILSDTLPDGLYVTNGIAVSSNYSPKTSTYGDISVANGIVVEKLIEGLYVANGVTVSSNARFQEFVANISTLSEISAEFWVLHYLQAGINTVSDISGNLTLLHYFKAVISTSTDIDALINLRETLAAIISTASFITADLSIIYDIILTAERRIFTLDNTTRILD